MRTLILTYPSESDDEAPLEGKFLQLRWAGRVHLLFAGVDEHRYHNQILGRFLSEQGIAHRWEGAQSLVVDHPELSIIGGGRFRLDLLSKQLRVWDASSVYGRFDSSALSAQLAAADPPWRELVLSVARARVLQVAGRLAHFPTSSFPVPGCNLTPRLLPSGDPIRERLVQRLDAR